MDGERLVQYMKGISPVAVAFSGGVDSSVIAKTAAIANKNSIAVTVLSDVMARRDIKNAKKMAGEIGITHKVIRCKQGGRFETNNKDRCYYCKKEVMGCVRGIADENGIKNIVDGSNYDDRKEGRPGMRACKEEEVITPLIDLGINKKEVRRIAKEMGLSNYDRVSNTCLATRIPYGRRIEKRALKRIEMAEEYIKGLTGVRVLRVRDYGGTARIEVGKREIGRLFKISTFDKIARRLKMFGYRHVSLDLEGYKKGGVE